MAGTSAVPGSCAAGASLLRVTPDDPTYRELAAAEARFWEQVHPQGLEAYHPVYADGPVDRHFNERFSGDPGVSWLERIPRHGPFRRGLMLGTVSVPVESYILESNPDLALTFVDISPGPLQRREAELGTRFPGRVATRRADLNFVALEANHYDLIVSSGTVHHVTNLEYLAFQINRALTPGGRFFLQDYVGEPRFDFTAEKRRIYEVIYERDLQRQQGRCTGLIWSDASDLSPFCGVRSDDILTVFRAGLAVLEEHTAAALVTPLMRSRPVDDRTPGGDWSADVWKGRVPTWRWLLARARERYPQVFGKRKSRQAMVDQRFLDELFVVGDVLTATGFLRPCIAFAIYGKRDAARG